MKLVIADASCLIGLENMKEVELLRDLYQQVFATPEVAEEVGDSLPDWVQLRSSSNNLLIDDLTTKLEIGEATSIALALDIPESILIIDEKKGRRTAIELGIAITGTFGILKNAIDLDLIKEPNTLIERLENSGFRISETLRSELVDRIH